MFNRHVGAKIQRALADTRVVLLAGPRQAGKTTLARSLATKGMRYLTLDDATVLAAARADPAGLIREIDRAVIDEVQRAPELLLAIKESVDRDTRPGRFLLTGSANLMTLPRVADSLAGRMETVRLMPLAQSEIFGRGPSQFLSALFAGQPPITGPVLIAQELIQLVLAGGYPEALTRRNGGRRQDWYESYIEAVIGRDVREIANIDQLDRMPDCFTPLLSIPDNSSITQPSGRASTSITSRPKNTLVYSSNYFSWRHCHPGATAPSKGSSKSQSFTFWTLASSLRFKV